MSHLLLVLCFAQSITENIAKYAETIKMRPRVCHNSNPKVRVVPSYTLHPNLWPCSRVSRSHQCRVLQRKPNTHQTEASVWEHGKKKICIHWGNTTYFIILSVWVTAFSTTQYFYCTKQLLPTQWWGTLGYLIISQTCTAGFYEGRPLKAVSQNHSVRTAWLPSPVTIPHSPQHHHHPPITLHSFHYHYLHFCTSHRQGKDLTFK